MTKKTCRECKSIIVFGDDFGDNHTTFHCSLNVGHSGFHQEKGDMSYKKDGGFSLPYTLKWKDEFTPKRKR